MIFLLLFSLFALPLYADQTVSSGSVSSGIDRAIEYSQAGRYDLAEKELSGMLAGNLGPVEKATVLYNLATAQAMQNNLKEAVASLDQITPDMYQEVVSASPLLAASISYNGATFSIRYANQLSGDVANIEKIARAIDTSRKDFTQLDLLFKKNIIPLDVSQPAIVRIHIAEEIATLEQQHLKLQELQRLLQLSKSELLDSFADLLWGYFFDAAYLFRAKAPNASAWTDYYLSFERVEFAEIQIYLARLVTFLNAPAKSAQVAMNDFFVKELTRLEGDVGAALSANNANNLLLALYSMTNTLTVLQGQILNNDIGVLLDSRTAVVASSSLDPQNGFWAKEWQAMNGFTTAYLDAKEASEDGLQKELLIALAKEINPEPDLQKCLDVSYFWQVLYTEESKSFKSLAETLHGAKSVDKDLLKKTIEPLLARVKAEKITYAIKPLEDTLKQLSHPSPILLYQDVMIGWFFADPDSALNYLFEVTSNGLNAIQTRYASSYDAFVAHADYQLLVHLLDLLIPKGQSVLSSVLLSLNQQLAWFSDPHRSDFTFFRMSLELDWLKTILLVRTDGLEKITESVDFEVLFQKKTLTLTRFSADQQYLSGMEELALMQTQMATEVLRGLSNIKMKSKKIDEVKALIDSVIKQTPSQTKDIPTMMNVLESLVKASAILHSMQGSSASPNPSSAQQQETNLSHEIPKMTLTLSPDNAIQLLQEMERQDKSLEQGPSASTASPGGRQW